MHVVQVKVSGEILNVPIDIVGDLVAAGHISIDDACVSQDSGTTWVKPGEIRQLKRISRPLLLTGCTSLLLAIVFPVMQFSVLNHMQSDHPTYSGIDAPTNTTQKKTVDNSQMTNLPTSLIISIPVLTVSSNSGTGNLSKYDMRIERNTGKPLGISVTEGFASSVSDVYKASLWQAATTIAFTRLDPMRGIRLSLEVNNTASGVDGPSAGGVMAVGILLAMDGKAFPKDLVMTGTILPDGSIGMVGGIPEKLVAASRAGAKRAIIPAYTAKVTNINNELIDLETLANSIGIELIRVSNLEDAYSVAAGLSRTKHPIADDPTLDKKWRALLDDYFTTTLNTQVAIDEKAIDESTLLQLAPERRKSLEAYRDGNYPAAAITLQYYASVLKLIRGAVRTNPGEYLLNIYKARLETDATVEVNRMIDSAVASFAVKPGCESAQFCVYSLEAIGSAAFGQFPGWLSRANELSASLANPENAKIKQNIINEATFFYDIAAKAQVPHYVMPLLLPLHKASSLSDGKMPSSEKIETIDVLLHQSISPAGAYVGMVASAGDNYLKSIDFYNDANKADAINRAAKVTAERSGDFGRLVSIYAKCKTLSIWSSQQLKEAIGRSLNQQGQPMYSNRDQLRKAIDEARSRAASSIAGSKEKNLPIAGAVVLFLAADWYRASTDEDPLTAVQLYIEAYLYSRTTHMLFN